MAGGELSAVVLAPEAFLACAMHACSTEAEEVMGLLLGDVRGGVAYVRRAVPQIRTDRRRDRVETSPEQMAAATALADRITAAEAAAAAPHDARRTRVVGWFHSHPHITVLPSHVDVATQALYQTLDRCFVGLIVAAFNGAGGGREHSLQATAFQAVAAGSPEAAAAAAAGLLLRGPLGSSGDGGGSGGADGLDEPTRAAIAAAAAADAADAAAAAASSSRGSSGGAAGGPGAGAGAAGGGGGWVRKEVPLRVAHDASNRGSLDDSVTVQRMLLEEERQAHGACATASSAGAGGDALHLALLRLQDAAVHQQALLQHAECALAPALAAMRQLGRQCDVQARQLERENARLRELLEARRFAEEQEAEEEEVLLPMPPPDLLA